VRGAVGAVASLIFSASILSFNALLFLALVPCAFVSTRERWRKARSCSSRTRSSSSKPSETDLDGVPAALKHA
jgi:hypothetical protein